MKDLALRDMSLTLFDALQRSVSRSLADRGATDEASDDIQGGMPEYPTARSRS